MCARCNNRCREGAVRRLHGRRPFHHCTWVLGPSSYGGVLNSRVVIAQRSYRTCISTPRLAGEWGKRRCRASCHLPLAVALVQQPIFLLLGILPSSGSTHCNQCDDPKHPNSSVLSTTAVCAMHKEDPVLSQASLENTCLYTCTAICISHRPTLRASWQFRCSGSLPKLLQAQVA